MERKTGLEPATHFSVYRKTKAFINDIPFRVNPY